MRLELLNKKILLDTNFLFYLIENKAGFALQDLQQLNEIFVPSIVIKELKILENEKKGFKKKVSEALKLIDVVGIKIVEFKGEFADNVLLEASKEGFIIGTMDKDLRKQIKSFGGRIIYLRQRKLINY